MGQTMKHHRLKQLTLGIIASFGVIPLAYAEPSIDYRIAWDDNDQRYHVYMKAIKAPTPNYNMTAQITIKAPYSEEKPFTIDAFTNTYEDVQWTSSGTAHAPDDDNSASYFSYSASFKTPTAIDWQADQEVEVFSFRNKNDCLGIVNIMSGDDPFNYPNSLGTNPGNQFTNMGWGNIGDNHYRENYGEANCLASDSNNDSETNPTDNPTDEQTDNPADNPSNNDNTTPIDSDNDGISDADEALLLTDPQLSDSDEDGIDDLSEIGGDIHQPLDTDGDGLINALDSDDDNDGVFTEDEDRNNDGDFSNDDQDNDGIPDYLDPIDNQNTSNNNTEQPTDNQTNQPDNTSTDNNNDSNNDTGNTDQTLPPSEHPNNQVDDSVANSTSGEDDSDNDGIINYMEGYSTDRDGDNIADRFDYDPSGYFYCENNGKILTGGRVHITGDAITMVEDGSKGYYQFISLAKGEYTLDITPPSGTEVSPYRPASEKALPMGDNLMILGAGEHGQSGYLETAALEVNGPWYNRFTMDSDYAAPVINNNIPLIGGVCNNYSFVDETKKIPTLSEWAQILLTLLIATIGIKAWQRRQH
ncbi:MAG TPA: IPTL-CTERM sorting domain-containing protein [Thiothrix sp.]|nr:IPTL-CTERM sorting domain-containing protein [Thiothrix sp.]